VVGVAGPKNIDFVKGLGADEVGGLLLRCGCVALCCAVLSCAGLGWAIECVWKASLF